MPSIYLSPSLQPYNKYVTTGDEQYWMNVIADDMVPILEQNGIAVSRNTPGMTLGAGDPRVERRGLRPAPRAALERRAGEPLRQAARAGRLLLPLQHRGQSAPRTSSPTTCAASIPTPDLVNTVATTKLAEITKTNAPAVLVEIAYHDNVQDEAWIRENTALIARNLAMSVCAYFGMDCKL